MFTHLHLEANLINSMSCSQVSKALQLGLMKSRQFTRRDRSLTIPVGKNLNLSQIGQPSNSYKNMSQHEKIQKGLAEYS